MTSAMSAQTRASLDSRSMDMHSVQDKQKDQANRLKERTEKAQAQSEKLGEIRAAWQDALAKGDIDALKIQNANFETAQREAAANSRDIAQMQVALLEGYKDIGVVVKAAEAFDEAEQKIIADAQTLLETAKGDLVQAQAMQWNVLGRRDSAIAGAKEGIATAEKAVVIANQDAATLRRARLNNMNLRQSLQLQQSITQELVEVAEGRIAKIETDLTSAQTNMTTTMAEIMSDTKLLEDLDEKLKAANGALTTLNEELGSYGPSSSEWQECQNRIVGQTRTRDEIEADRNSAFMRAEEGKRFFEFNRIEEQGQVQMLAQHKNWIALLQMGTKQRDVLIEIHVGLLQGTANLEAMSMQDSVATESDKRMAVEAVMKTEAMRRATMARVQSLPGMTRDMRELVRLDMENQARMEREWDEELEKFRRNFDTPVGYDDRGAYRTAPAS